MSDTISLVVLRLAIAEGHELPSYINYKAPEFKIFSSEYPSGSHQTNSTYIAVPGSSKTDSANLDPISICRGNRKFVELTIETYINDMFARDTSTGSIDLSNNTSSKMASEENKEVPKDKQDMKTAGPSAVSTVTATIGEKGRTKEVYFEAIGEQETPVSSRKNSRPNSGDSSRPKSHSPTPRGSPTMQFYSGNPMVERTTGILHMYKDNKMTSLKDDVSRSELICMLAVPAAYTIHDLVKFTAPVVDGMEYMRIIRDSTPNLYMVLLKFKNQKFADEFYNNFNNTQYNSIEPDICQLIYVAEVETMKDSDGACLPVPGLTELPNCPVCLERMDESVDGILTILCNHIFHIKCLAQWGDTSCPVCRYCQTPEEVADNRCMTCGSQESLWICLICGNIGCGRYVELHAYKHFQQTQHTYAMQLGNNAVWDYVGDNFVHRLAQSKGDGKLVEINDGHSRVNDEKVDSLSLEYTYLLTSQLESQRKYFEERIVQVEKSAHERAENLETKFKVATEDLDKVKVELQNVTKEKQQFEKKCSHLHTRLTSTMKDLQEEREMNKCLLENQQVWQKKVTVLESHVKNLTEEKETEIKELSEQLRDVMFFMDAQKKLQSTTEISQDELEGSQVFVGATGSTPSPKSKKGRKKDR